ncbi:hypothetical protein Tco_0693007 [Tanacetum coccineum]
MFVNNQYFCIRNFPTIFCLKINHGGAFTKPPKIRYNGSKVNWIDNIDSDAYSVNEVSDMMKNIGYDNVGMEFYFKERKTKLDKGLRKLATDSDVMEMLKFVSMYKVIDLYVDHSVCKEPMNVDHSVCKAIILYDPRNLDNFLDNDADEVLDDVSEDEWLQESLRKLPRFSQCGGQSSNNVDNASNNVDNVVYARRNRTKDLVIIEHVANEGNAVSEDESESEYGSDSDDSDFIVDEENLIHDVDVDMQDFNDNTDAHIERMGCKESVQEVYDVFHVEEDIDFEDFDSGTDSGNKGLRKKAIRQLGKMNKAAPGKLPVFTNDGTSVDDGPSNTDGPSEASGSANLTKGQKIVAP